MPHRHCSHDQMYGLYHWGREQGYPVDKLNWEEYVAFLRRKAPHMLASAVGGAPPFAHPCIFDRWEQEEKPSLLFDGKYLHWQQGRKSTSWEAYSGDSVTLSTGNYSVDRQKLKDKGPLPEGLYVVPQDRYQTRPDDAWNNLKAKFGGSAWPWGSSAWGDERIWLEPKPTTNLYGRSNFTIHGGSAPRSRGCIDLVKNMGAFARLFRQYGKDVLLEVRYSKAK